MTTIVRLAILLILVASPAAGADWPHLRGPGFDGRAEGGGSFDAERLALKSAWRTPIGSGYSGIAVASGRAVTMYSDGKSDWVAAFDAATGKVLWRQRIADAYLGHDGSDDGPVSAPAIADETVFALGPRGELLALRLADGGVVWSKRLEADFGAKAPVYGFGSSPVVEQGVLIVQPGGSDGRTIVGLDPRTGATRWSYAGEASDYQSPTPVTLAGRRQIVTVGRKAIAGLDPASGRVIWSHTIGEKEWFGSGVVTPLGDDRLLVPMMDGMTTFRIARTDDVFAIAEAYRSTALGGGYAQPVLHDGHVYGFRGQVLTCMRAADGERLWRSREPGGDGLVLADGKLVIFGAKGQVVVADATPDGYRERARVRALGGSSLTWPAVADGRVFVRNLDEIAAVAVAEATTAEPAPVASVEHEFGRWVRKVEAAEPAARPALVESYWTSHTQSPIVEGRFLHFLWRGEAKDVAIGGSITDAETVDAMRRIEGTDLFYRTYEVDPGARWEYRFQIDFETAATDPRNPRKIPGVEGPDLMSEVATPGYQIAAFLEEPTGTRGRVDSFTLKSERLGYEKALEVWLPPGYDTSERRYPLLLVQDGESWRDKGALVNALDNLAGKRVAPVVVAFVPGNRRFWLETGGARTDDYVAMLADELVPALVQRYRLAADPASRALLGNQFYGFSAIYAAVRRPDVFGGAAVQSPYTGLGSGDALFAAIDEGRAKPLRLYVDWNRFDGRNVDRDYDFAEDSRTLFERLRASGSKVEGGEVLDSYGWGGWRNRVDRALAALFPTD